MLNNVFDAKMLFANVTGILHLHGWVWSAMSVTRGLRLSGPFSFHSDYDLKTLLQEHELHIRK